MRSVDLISRVLSCNGCERTSMTGAVNGGANMLSIKPEVKRNTTMLNMVVRSRRATQSFKPEPVADHVLKELLELSLLAPSGYNLQPWRFIVVRDPENKKRLREAAMGQAKVEEAPVVVIACADPTAWHDDIDNMLEMSRNLGRITSNEVENTIRKGASFFLESVDNKIWATKQTMIAFTYLMLLAETYGLDTAPMEGFWEDKVKEAFDIPDHFLVLALLAIGYASKPDHEFGGRFDFEKLVSSETYGKPLKLE
jgi:nitroreductase